MTGLTTTLLIVSIIAVSVGIIAIIYIALAARRRNITMKKVDYLVEDITFKSETLSSTVETIAKMANYIDAFETLARKNIKSATRLINRNKDDLYKIADRIKKIAIGDQDQKDKKGKK